MNSFRTERNNCRRRLIMLVKKNPILWNKTRVDYKRNRPKKSQTWQDIAEQLGASADKIRRTWENLRDQYRRDLKRELKYGYHSKWRFFNDMDFIRDMVNCKEPHTEFTDSDSEMESTELSHFLQKALDPNARFAEPNRVVRHHTTAYSNAMVNTPHVTEFHPIILSKQWQKEQSNQVSYVPVVHSATEAKPRENPTTAQPLSPPLSAQLPSYSDTLRKIQPNPPNIRHLVHFDHGISGDDYHTPAIQPTNAIPDTIEIKSETNSDIEMEQNCVKSLPAPVLPSNAMVKIQLSGQEKETFQEAQVSTSSLQHSAQSPAAQLEQRSSVSCKKRKSSKCVLENRDDDYYFVMSLLPSLRQIPRNKKIALRIAFMNMIAKDLEDVCK